tara:strand:- start:217 stop:1035 length:819 start_codon:yes stop_codon:yes gene_type:complete
MCKSLKVCLLIIGDEILSGKRSDKHFCNSREILAKRGLAVDKLIYVKDDLNSLEKILKFCFADEHIMFSFGGIGSTPDDLTRTACAKALGRKLEFNLDAVKLVKKRCSELGIELTQTRLEMARFPRFSKLIPNPISGFPGFSVDHSYFLPGFPEMASSMMEWILDKNYCDYFKTFSECDFFYKVSGIFESSISNFMELIKEKYPMFSIYSLPRMLPKDGDPSNVRLELGLKASWLDYNRSGADKTFELAKNELRREIQRLGGKIVEESFEKR